MVADYQGGEREDGIAYLPGARRLLALSGLTETSAIWPLWGQSGHQPAIADRFISTRPSKGIEHLERLPAGRKLSRCLTRHFQANRFAFTRPRGICCNSAFEADHVRRDVSCV
jgi:hypothetical protein